MVSPNQKNLNDFDALPIKDKLGMLHGKSPDNIWVIISADGSTVVRDPGVGRPWSSPNKKIAEHMAQSIPGKPKVVTLADAIKSVTYHQKNLPKYLPKGFKLPDA